MKLLIFTALAATALAAPKQLSKPKKVRTILDSETWRDFDPIRFEGVLRESPEMRIERHVREAENILQMDAHHRRLDYFTENGVAKAQWACKMFGFDFSEPGVPSNVSYSDCVDPNVGRKDYGPTCAMFPSNPNADGFNAAEDGQVGSGVKFEPAARRHYGCSWVFGGYKPVPMVSCVNPVEARVGFHIPSYELDSWYGVDGLHTISFVDLEQHAFPTGKTNQFKIVKNLDMGSCDGEELGVAEAGNIDDTLVYALNGSGFVGLDIIKGPQYYHILGNQNSRAGINIVLDSAESELAFSLDVNGSDYGNIYNITGLVTYNNFAWGHRMEECVQATTCDECAQFSNLGCGWCAFPEDWPEELSGINWTTYYNYQADSKGSCGFTATKCLSVGGATFTKGADYCPQPGSPRSNQRRGFFDGLYGPFAWK